MTCRWKSETPTVGQTGRGFGTTRGIMAHELHPLCTLFPRLSGAEFDALVADIKANGLRQPIVTHEGMILDGGNRYRACIEAGVKPTFQKFTGGNLVSFVLSANLHRRHMSPGQQAAIVASAQDWAKANIQGRNKVTGNVAGDTIADRAKQSGASERTQRMADKVAKKSPELARKVAHGEVSLPKAAKSLAPSKPAAKPEPKPKPKKGEPTIESLLAENAALKEELHEARDVARNLAHELESYETVSAGEKAAAKELTRLKGLLATVEATRDQWMTTANTLKGEVKALQRKLGVRK